MVSRLPGGYKLYVITGHPGAPAWVRRGDADDRLTWSGGNGIPPGGDVVEQCDVGINPGLDPLPSHVQSAVYHRGPTDETGYVWLCMTADANLELGTPADGFAEIIWGRIAPPPLADPVLRPDVYEIGYIDGSEVDSSVFMPSISVNEYGDVLVGFTESSPTICPRLSYAWREASAVRYTGFHPAQVAFSTANYFDSALTLDPTREIWGRCSANVLDPTGSFWMANEYAHNNSEWGTRVFEIGVPTTGACCYFHVPSGTTNCGDWTEEYCTTPNPDWSDVTFQGLGTKCPTDGTSPVVHDGEVAVHITDSTFTCASIARGQENKCSTGPPYLDTWETTGEGDRQVAHTFGGHPCSDCIPPDFFEPGSSPFCDTVELKGRPLGETEWGYFETADTLVRRWDEPFEPCDAPSEAASVIGAEIVALSLESKAPIVVNLEGQPTYWDVFVDLSVVQAGAGPLSATKNHCNGGTYYSILPVQPRFTFTKVSGPGVPAGTVVAIDTGLEFICPLVLDQQDGPWVHRPDPNLHLESPFCTDFHPGIEDLDPLIGSACDCQGNDVTDDCDVDPTDPDGDGMVYDDCDQNGRPDECDPDGDSDGTIDACDNCPNNWNSDQADGDSDGFGNVCDPCDDLPSAAAGDEDGDGADDGVDNCPCGPPNPGQEDVNGNGIGDACEEPFGSCCLGSGPCLLTTAATCANYYGGSYAGNGIVCTVRGACCLPGGSCVQTTQGCCEAPAFGGTYQGDGTDCPLRSPPSYVTATDEDYDDRVGLTWIAVAGTVSYEVWRNTSPDTATAALIATSVTETTYDDYSAVPGVVYSYWVKATNGCGYTSYFSASDTGWRGGSAMGACCDGNTSVCVNGTYPEECACEQCEWSYDMSCAEITCLIPCTDCFPCDDNDVCTKDLCDTGGGSCEPTCQIMFADATDNGVVNMADVLACNGSIPLGLCGMPPCDVNPTCTGNGVLNTADVLAINGAIGQPDPCGCPSRNCP